MAKSVKSLSGEAKDAYLARLAAASGPAPDAQDNLAKRLQSEVTRVWVKVDAVASEAGLETASPAEQPPVQDDGFDPFKPNVVVLLRTRGRDQALTALEAIGAPDRLRRLAREQQLSIDPELAGAAEIRSAIIAAAERRVANRRAAAS